MRRDIEKQNEVFAEEISQIKSFMKQLIASKNNNKELNDIFPVQSKQDLQALEDKLTEYDEDDFVSIVKKIIRRGGILKNLHNLLGEEIIKEFNYDGLQNKEALKSYFKVDNLLFKVVEPEVNTFDNYKLVIKKAFKYEKIKFIKKNVLKKKIIK